MTHQCKQSASRIKIVIIDYQHVTAIQCKMTAKEIEKLL